MIYLNLKSITISLQCLQKDDTNRYVASFDLTSNVFLHFAWHRSFSLRTYPSAPKRQKDIEAELKLLGFFC